MRPVSNLKQNKPMKSMKSEQPKNLLYSILRISFVLLVAVLLTAPASAQEAAQPSREKFIDTLRTIAKQLEAKKYAETEKYFYLPEQFEHKMFGRLVEAKMISSQGVEALDPGGDYGAADGILRKSDAEEYAARGSATVDQCFAIKMSQGDYRAKVVAHWTGEHFKILDINGVGKLDPDKVEVAVGAPAKPWPTGHKPTKELLIETLKVFLHRVQARHYDTLRQNVYVPDDFDMSQFADSLERGELSTEGIKILTDRGSTRPKIGYTGAPKATRINWSGLPIELTETIGNNNCQDYCTLRVNPDDGRYQSYIGIDVSGANGKTGRLTVFVQENSSPESRLDLFSDTPRGPNGSNLTASIIRWSEDGKRSYVRLSPETLNRKRKK